MNENRRGGADEFELVVGGRVTHLDGDWSIRARTGSAAFVLGPSELSRIIHYAERSQSGSIIDVPMVDHLESEARDFYDRLGPWATGRAVCAALGVTFSALGQQRKGRRLLGVAFGAKHDFFYPVQQFVDGRVADGLREVLTALSAGYVSAEAQAGWFAEPAWEGRSETRWDVLRSGDVRTVVEWADADAHAVAA